MNQMCVCVCMERISVVNIKVRSCVGIYNTDCYGFWFVQTKIFIQLFFYIQASYVFFLESLAINAYLLYIYKYYNNYIPIYIYILIYYFNVRLTFTFFFFFFF